ncbi:hypothetical protein RND81_03G201500 [Saponaria officinalis]|uniref:Cytochrome P450 n=1 Tax=Saponaria officinalis TaxID=3572 RepID=A0AAW1M1Q2_SAPOF
MEFYTLSFSIILIIFTVFSFLKSPRKSTTPKLPPGPKTWPIIGNIHQIGSRPHQSVTELSKKYGAIMSLKLGTMTTIVVSSPNEAKQLFTNHDLAFSSRKIPHAATISEHYRRSIIWLSVCPKWRDIRKIAVTQLFTSNRLASSQGLRQKKIDDLIEHVRHCCEKGQAVCVGNAAFTTTLNLLSNTIFSVDLGSHDSSDLQEFKDIVSGLMEVGAAPNVSDFFPLVRRLDLQGVFKRSCHLFDRMIVVFDRIIDKRLSDRFAVNDDVLGTLFKLVEDDELNLVDIRHIIMDLFAAGTDTTSSTIEWAMTELLRNPEKMAKAQDEIDQVIGNSNNKLVQETDISKLPYIQAVVKETLRLHPPAPFLVPRKAEKNVNFCGFLVPENAQIWVNVWAIGRDPRVWSDPLSFSPERFLESEISFKGGDFELIPFGAGRRVCPGIPLAHRMLHHMLASLLHLFNWKHAHGSSPRDIDMEEKFGITLQKVVPLQAIPFNR